MIIGCTFRDSPLRKNKTEHGSERDIGGGEWRGGEWRGVEGMGAEGRGGDCVHSTQRGKKKKMLSAEEAAVCRVSRMLIVASMGTSKLAGILEMMMEERKKKQKTRKC